jgi:hypothetical protein
MARAYRYQAGPNLARRPTSIGLQLKIVTLSSRISLPRSKRFFIGPDHILGLWSTGTLIGFVLALGKVDERRPGACRNQRAKAQAPRHPAARRLRIRMTCAAYHWPPLDDGTLRSLKAAAAAIAGSAGEFIQDRPEPLDAVRHRLPISVIAQLHATPGRIGLPHRCSGRPASKLDRQPVENEDQPRPRHIMTVAF